MPEREMLDQLHTYAADVSECARTISVPDGLLIHRDGLKDFADQVISEIDAPLRIGFVGEFSAGKSLLLGVLAGKPDLLPTSMEPTTGNVTELHFSRAASDAPATGIDRVRVHFFRASDLDQLDKRILADLRDRARRARLTAADLADLDAHGDSWDLRFRDWCAQMSHRDDGELRKLILELTRTRDAATAAPGYLGQTVTITLDQLRGMLEIRYPSFQNGFPPPPSQDSVPFSENPDSTQLAATFPLVERVLLDIALPPDRWPVSAMPANQGFVLLDFPGIGGANTKARDLFLTRRGLDDVHTILVLVNAGRAGSQIPDTFYGFLRDLDSASAGDDDTTERLSGRIIYCAGRFDEIPPPEPSFGGPSDTARMTVDRLLNACRPLSALLQSGHQPGLSAMRAFASSVLAISKLRLTDVPAELGLEFHRQAAEARAARWKTIAESLRADGTGQELVRELLAYADDGGVEELRRLLEQHVHDHGLALRTRRAQDRLDQLDELKARLEDDLRASQQNAGDDGTSPATQARALLRDVRRSREELIRQLRTLRDPGQIGLAPQWSVKQDVMRKAADLVMAWPEWAAILSCVENAVVVPSRGPAKNLLGLEEWADIPDADGLPQRLGDFEEAFARTCDELRDYAKDRSVAGTKRWLEGRAATPEARDLHRRTADLLNAEVRARLTDRKLARFPLIVERICNPASMAENVATMVDREKPQSSRTRVFPLRAEQLASWAEGSPADEGAKHFVRIVRMRSALIDSICDYALSCLDAVQNLVFGQLDDAYRLQQDWLPDESQFVAAVLGQQSGSRDESPDPAGALAALRRPDKDPAFGG
jgi:hypothetical protein